MNSFVDVAEYLLDQDGVQCLLSSRFNQDPLEEFFGKQRAHGGRCDNPTVEQFLKNSVSLRVQKSAAVAPRRGNCRNLSEAEVIIEDIPIPKRRCCRSTK